MINLLVDEAYSFDYLAILFIKKNINNNCLDTWIKCSNHIKSQIGEDMWNKVVESKEYSDLIEINQQVFDAVERARYGSISAKEVDYKNMQRYYQKIKLQNAFFANSQVKETKT